MAAPIGNKFWQIRAKHGRDTLFGSPELLWEAACEYFEWCDENPLNEVQAFAYQGEVTKEDIPHIRAYTLNGLCLYLGCNEAYFRTFKSQERANKEEYNTVISKIEKTIYDQKFTAAAAGLLNANIISRDLGLIDKTESKSEIKVSKNSFDDLTTEELRKLAKNGDDSPSSEEAIS